MDGIYKQIDDYALIRSEKILTFFVNEISSGLKDLVEEHQKHIYSIINLCILVISVVALVLVTLSYRGKIDQFRKEIEEIKDFRKAFLNFLEDKTDREAFVRILRAYTIRQKVLTLEQEKAIAEQHKRLRDRTPNPENDRFTEDGTTNSSD